MVTSINKVGATTRPAVSSRMIAANTSSVVAFVRNKASPTRFSWRLRHSTAAHRLCVASIAAVKRATKPALRSAGLRLPKSPTDIGNGCAARRRTLLAHLQTTTAQLRVITRTHGRILSPATYHSNTRDTTFAPHMSPGHGMWITGGPDEVVCAGCRTVLLVAPSSTGVLTHALEACTRLNGSAEPGAERPHADSDAPSRDCLPPNPVCCSGGARGSLASSIQTPCAREGKRGGAKPVLLCRCCDAREQRTNTIRFKDTNKQRRLRRLFLRASAPLCVCAACPFEKKSKRGPRPICRMGSCLLRVS